MIRRIKCSVCKKYKIPRYFHKNKAYHNGRSNVCASCFNKERREGKWKRPSEKRHTTYLKNRHNQKNQELISTYGITLEQFNQMRIKQDYLCAICGKHETESNKGLHTDHCHKTNKVRGLLCNSCNLAIGQLKHNITILKKAIEYLGQ